MDSMRDEGIISPEMWTAFEQSAIWLDIKATLEIRIEEIMRNLASEETTKDLVAVRELQQELRDFQYFVNFPKISVMAITGVKEGQNASRNQ